MPPSSAPAPNDADEQSGAGLREPELVRVAGNERRERAEQHRVDEHDDGDENEQPAHPADVTDRQLRALPLSPRRSPLNQAANGSLSEP